MELRSTHFCYPKGNFRRNQLLGDSISLSPLYADLKINLHVRTPSSLHQRFRWLRPIHAKFVTFRVAALALLLRSLAAARDWSMRPGLFRALSTSLSFLAPSGLPPKDSRGSSTPWSVFQDGVFGGISCGIGPRWSWKGRVRGRGEAATEPGRAPGYPCGHSRDHPSDPSPPPAPALARRERASEDAVDELATLPPKSSLCAVSGSFHRPLGLLFIFPSRYLFAIGLSSVFSLGWILPPA